MIQDAYKFPWLVLLVVVENVLDQKNTSSIILIWFQNQNAVVGEIKYLISVKLFVKQSF